MVSHFSYLHYAIQIHLPEKADRNTYFYAMTLSVPLLNFMKILTVRSVEDSGSHGTACWPASLL